MCMENERESAVCTHAHIYTISISYFILLCVYAWRVWCVCMRCALFFFFFCSLHDFDVVLVNVCWFCVCMCTCVCVYVCLIRFEDFR